jgi:hypothetical protein
VSRPTIYGNPFRITDTFLARVAVTVFAEWADKETVDPKDYAAEHVRLMAALDRGDLRGHDLACWCPLDQPCHADVLLELANGCARARP